MNLLVAKKLLRETKVQLALAHSGMECLKLTAKNNYDVIFMDHMMPEMDGEKTIGSGSATSRVDSAAKRRLLH